MRGAEKVLTQPDQKELFKKNLMFSHLINLWKVIPRIFHYPPHISDSIKWFCLETKCTTSITDNLATVVCVELSSKYNKV